MTTQCRAGTAVQQGKCAGEQRLEEGLFVRAPPCPGWTTALALMSVRDAL